MEVFLHLWDELDDLSAAGRHLAASAASELVEGVLPLVVAGASVLGLWMVEGVYRHLLRLSV